MFHKVGHKIKNSAAHLFDVCTFGNYTHAVDVRRQ